LFSVPGAFTPTCSAKHLPGFVTSADAIKKKGIDTIACMAVNDVFVMRAWGDSSKVGDKVLMLADGNGEYARALGLELDASKFGMGTRGKRFSMIVKDGVVTQLNRAARRVRRELGRDRAQAALARGGAKNRSGAAGSSSTARSSTQVTTTGGVMSDDRQFVRTRPQRG
jgi:peroxiredoxin